MGLGWDILVSPSIPAQCWACSWARMSSSWNREYTITVFIFYAAACCRNKLPQTQQLQTTQIHDFIVLYIRSLEQSKIKVSAGLWSFPEAPEGISSLIWIFRKIQFFGCYGTEVPFPCCLSAESCLYFHSLAYVLFLHFQASYSLMKLSDSLVVKERGQGNARGPLIFVIRTLPDPGICSMLLELGWGRQKPTKNWSAMKYDMSLEGWCVYLSQAHILPSS